MNYVLVFNHPYMLTARHSSEPHNQSYSVAVAQQLNIYRRKATLLT